MNRDMKKGIKFGFQKNEAKNNDQTCVAENNKNKELSKKPNLL